MKTRVYFAQAADQSIKIGVTTDVAGRIKTLSAGVPGGVRLLCSIGGAYSLEAYLHDLFAKHRISGEWFMPAAEILALVDDILSRGQDAMPKGYAQPQYGEAEALSKRAKAFRDEMGLLMRACAFDGSDTDEDVVQRTAKTTGIPAGRVEMYLQRRAPFVTAEDYERALLVAARVTRDKDVVRLINNAVSRVVGTLARPAAGAAARAFPDDDDGAAAGIDEKMRSLPDDG